jgi:hypothetical protein
MKKDKAREIVKGLKEQTQDIYRDLKPGKNNVIIPFSDSIKELLQKKKAEDMTRVKQTLHISILLTSSEFSQQTKDYNCQTGRYKNTNYSFSNF